MPNTTTLLQLAQQTLKSQHTSKRQLVSSIKSHTASMQPTPGTKTSPGTCNVEQQPILGIQTGWMLCLGDRNQAWQQRWQMRARRMSFLLCLMSAIQKEVRTYTCMPFGFFSIRVGPASDRHLCYPASIPHGCCILAHMQESAPLSSACMPCIEAYQTCTVDVPALLHTRCKALAPSLQGVVYCELLAMSLLSMSACCCNIIGDASAPSEVHACPC